ncbi:MAG: dihydroneopterin aldolase [Acidimicrobiales bacterium]
MGRGEGGGDRIELRGLRVVGSHGVLPEERARAQPFEVDIDLYADLGPAGGSGGLGDTVDYASLCQAAAAVFAGPNADLIETLAQRVAGAVLAAAAPSGSSVTVTVRKLRPPVPHDLASAAVTIHRSP